MLDSSIKVESAAIVLLGSFNPKIFHPSWLASENMVTKQEAESAEVSVVHPEVTAFTMNKIQYEVTRDRFVIQSTYSPSFNVMKDLVLGMFGLLHYTPVHALGLNREFHFLLQSEDAWHSLGHKVAPKDIWVGILEKPGTRKLIVEGIRSDGREGCVRIEFAPSARIHPGLFFSVNDHFQLASKDAASGCQEMLDLVRHEWDASLERSKAAAFKFLERT